MGGKRTEGPSTPGLEHINRYWDPRAGRWAAKLLPGEYYISTARELLVTVAGSSIGVGIFDTQRAVVGMVHFILPLGEQTKSVAHALQAVEYGQHAMDLLISGVLRHGGRRQDLEAHVFGAGTMWPHAAIAAEATVRFVEHVLATEGISVATDRALLAVPSKGYLCGESGQLSVHTLRQYNDTIRRRENFYLSELEHQWMEYPGLDPSIIADAGEVAARDSYAN